MEVPPQLRDFKNFLFLCWKQLNLPDPTPLQYDIADYMQHGDKRAIVQAFRGCGKSWICSAYVVHQLLMDQSLNILVVSASKTRSDDFSTFTLRLIHEMEILHHLRPTDNQRQSKISFDVGGAPASHAPSVKSLGITSQLTGSRADIIVLDDVEVANNSATQMMREKLSESVREVDAILKPLDTSRVLFLGTPQTEDSLYSKIQERGYKTKIWPACHVTPSENEKTYNGNIAPMCVSEKDKGRSTEPLRFSDVDLAERKISYGSAGFALQFQLDSTLADVDRFPLKVSDLIVTTVDCDLAPEKYVWARDPNLEWDSSIPNVAFAGERYHRPFKTLGDMVEYNGSVLAIDPAGRGTDETSYAVVKMLNGVLYVPAAGGLQGGYSEEVLEKLCNIAKDHKVNYVLSEMNFGGGMFTELLKPVLTRIYPVTLEEVRHSQQKEKRIVDTLEPVMSGHRLVIDPKVIQEDYKTVQHYPHEKQLQYSLFYQMSRMTRERGAIRHDDRLDSLAMGVAYWVEQMAQDANIKMAERKVELLDQELQKFQDSYFKNKGGASALTW